MSVSESLPAERGAALVVTVEEAGRLLGISRGLAYGLVAHHELPHVRLGRRIVIPRTALEALLNPSDSTTGGRSTNSSSRISPTAVTRSRRCRRGAVGRARASQAPAPGQPKGSALPARGWPR